jgi:hypothetical protein
MKEMTSAEFKRANFEELTEPVAIKRYKDIRGYYYPVGFEPDSVTEIGAAVKVVGIEDVLEAEIGPGHVYPSLDIADMFRQIAKDLREIKQDTPCSDPLFHDHG